MPGQAVCVGGGDRFLGRSVPAVEGNSYSQDYSLQNA